MSEYAPIWATCLACLFSIMTGLLCWALRSEIKSLKTEFTLELTKALQQFADKVDKVYLRKDSFQGRRISPSKARPRSARKR